MKKRRALVAVLFVCAAGAAAFLFGFPVRSGKALPDVEGLYMLPSLGRYPVGTTFVEARWYGETGVSDGRYMFDRDLFCLQEKRFGKWHAINEGMWIESLLIPVWPVTGDIVAFDLGKFTDGLKRGEYRIAVHVEKRALNGSAYRGANPEEGKVCCYFSVR